MFSADVVLAKHDYSPKNGPVPNRTVNAYPEISRFFGIVVAMYYDDHAPPHFHAPYGSERAEFCIDPPGILKGASRRERWRW